MRKLLLVILVFMILSVVEYGRADVVYGVQVSPSSPASLALGQNVTITFQYRTSQAGGVRIFARPFSGGALTPNYAASGSPLYPVGGGSGSGTFTITSGNVVVDHIRFQVLNSDQSQLLLEFFVPVEYHFSTHSISNIVFAPVSPAAIQLSQNLNVTFDYTTDQSGGVRIFARPFTHGSLSPGYSASGSPLYATGSGSGAGSFTFSSGDVVVDSVRFQMLNSDQSQLLLEFFVPVNYHFAAHAIANVQLSPTSPVVGIPLNQDVSLTFDYTTNQSGGVRIFARPFTHGGLTPSYAASGSPLYSTGNGSGSGTFTITSGTVVVDSVRFQMYNSDQSQLLMEMFVPVEYHFGTDVVSGVQFSPTSPAYFTMNEDDTISFTYTTTQSGGARIFPRPFTNGSLTPNYAASGSPLYPTGSGNGDGFYAITSGPVVVDHVRMQMLNADQSQLLFELFAPVRFYYGNVTTSAVRDPMIGAPREFALDQNYPNPFNPATSFGFQVSSSGFVSLKVFDVLGREVAALVNEVKPPGEYTVRWDASNQPSGVYFYRIQAGSFAETKKMLLTR